MVMVGPVALALCVCNSVEGAEYFGSLWCCWFSRERYHHGIHVANLQWLRRIVPYD